MPIRCAVFITRQAISPRLAINIFLNIPLQRDVAVLAPGVLYLLVAQHRERAADPPARLVRHDHVVDVAAVPRDERVRELLAVLGLARRELRRVALFLAEDDLDRSLRAHDRDLG